MSAWNSAPLVMLAGAVCSMAMACLAAVAEPTLNVVQQQGPARPLKPWTLTCEVRWTGEAGSYVILPAQVDPISWGTVTVKEAIASVRDNANVVTQIVEVISREPGEHQVPEIRVPYLLSRKPKPPAAPTPGTLPPSPEAPPFLRAGPFSLLVRPRSTPAWVAGGFGLFVASSGTGWWVVGRYRKRKRIAPGDAASPQNFSSAATALSTARQHRCDGRPYECYRELLRAAEHLSSKEVGLVNHLKKRIQDVGYKGERPSDDFIDGDFREVERALKRCREEAEG